VSSGASFAAVLAIRLGVAGALGGAAIGVAALAGAAITIALVWRLGKVGDSLPPATLLLAGVTISMFCGAASMLVQMTSDFRDIGYMVRWMMGDAGAVTYDQLAMAAPAIGLGLAVLIWCARDLNALAAGPEAAASVGVDAGRTETVVFAVASLLVGASIAVAGPIGFIGLMVPHALRAVVGPDHRVLIPASILAGGGFLVACDTIARIATPGNQIPVGVITALLGGPFFVLILVRAKRSAGLWGM
jgi:iron complex transport system permease protein